MQQMQLGIFCAVVIAFIVCSCILTRRPTKRPANKHKEAKLALEILRQNAGAMSDR